MRSFMARPVSLRENNSQIQPAFLSGQITDIANQLLVGLRCANVLLEQVFGYRQPVVSIRRSLEFPSSSGPQPLRREAATVLRL